MPSRSTMMRILTGACAPAVATALSLAAAPAADIPPEPGEIWETTVQMTMGGMEMPAMTQQACLPKNASEGTPPMPKDGKCEISDVRTTGSKTSWAVSCKEPEPMTGTGEIVYEGRDKYAGTMTMKSSMGEMVMQMRGRRIGTPCDAAEMKRNVAAQQAQVAEGLEALCQDAAKKLVLNVFTGPKPTCTDPKDKETFCKALRTEEAYSQLGQSGAAAFADAAKFCGTDAEGVRKELCANALKSESLVFLGKNCPVEAGELAKRECAGRDYTALQGSRYRDFCVAYAADVMAGKQPKEGEPAQIEPKQDTLEKAKKKLKGLFGR